MDLSGSGSLAAYSRMDLGSARSRMDLGSALAVLACRVESIGRRFKIQTVSDKSGGHFSTFCCFGELSEKD
jgi:hypothetical protein